MISTFALLLMAGLSGYAQLSTLPARSDGGSFVEPSSSVIGGRVTDSVGRPVPGVSVSLTGASSASTTSGSDGRFLFANLSRGAGYSVSVSQSAGSFSPQTGLVSSLDTDTWIDFVRFDCSYVLSTLSNFPSAGGGSVSVNERPPGMWMDFGFIVSLGLSIRRVWLGILECERDNYA